MDADDLLELLGKAVTCAVLGKTGPQRSRVLGLLHKVNYVVIFKISVLISIIDNFSCEIIMPSRSMHSFARSLNYLTIEILMSLY